MNVRILLLLLLSSLLISSCGHRGWMKYGQRKGWLDTTEQRSMADLQPIPTINPKLQQVKLDLVAEIGAIVQPCGDTLTELQAQSLDSVITSYVPRIVQGSLEDTLTFTSADGKVKFNLYPGPLNTLTGDFVYTTTEIKAAPKTWLDYTPIFGILALVALGMYAFRKR